jgi:DNA primase
MQLHGLDFKQAAKWLQERYLNEGLARGNNVALAKTVKPRVALPTDVGREFSIDPEIYEWILCHSPLQDAGRSYLNSRKISDKTLEEFRVGQIGDSFKLRDSALTEFGHERLHRAGLVTLSASSNFTRLVFPSNYLLFPFIVDERCEYLQARAVGNVATGPRWKCPNGLSPPVFNVGALANRRISFYAKV